MYFIVSGYGLHTSEAPAGVGYLPFRSIGVPPMRWFRHLPRLRRVLSVWRVRHRPSAAEGFGEVQAVHTAAGVGVSVWARRQSAPVHLPVLRTRHRPLPRQGVRETLRRTPSQRNGAHGMTPRKYSRDFTPSKRQKRRYLMLDKIPADLDIAVRAKAKREGISLRALILGWLKEWSEDTR
jgi:hypothetical protein